MRIAFIANGSVKDRRAWSGTTYYAFRALQPRFDVVAIETPLTRYLLRLLRRIMRTIGVDPIREMICSSFLGARLTPLLRSAHVDAAFVLGASHIAGGLVDRIPVIHCSDATFASMSDYHGEFRGLSRRTVRAGNTLEQRVLSKSAAVVLASQWAMESAVNVYGRKHNVHIVPFGANIDQLPIKDRWKKRNFCELLFIGVNWHEKGADIAVQTAGILNQRGINTVLHIVGCEPPPDFIPPSFVRLHGFLRKAIPEQYSLLTTLISTADFLIVPTRFEAFGIVFCEAAAYGTPAIATDTGGVSTIIEDGLTGALLPLAGEADVYADRIQQISYDEVHYSKMRQRAFARAHNILNWNAWGESVEAIIRNTLSRRSL